MNTQPEPISAVLADMRRDARSGEHADGPLIEDYADRIEAAYKREHAEWHAETDAAKDDRNRVACRMRREFAEKCRNCERAPYNAVVLRAALTAFVDSIQWLCDGDERGIFKKQFAPLLSEARAALAAPARNCDCFATIDDARLEFQKVRGHKVWADIELWDNMDEVGAFVRWLFAQAKGGAE